VIGRLVTRAVDPRAACEAILAELAANNRSAHAN
jgi:orotidine-5'-phosphate decarboxylase